MSEAYDKIPNIRVRLDPEDQRRMQEFAHANERSLAAELRMAVRFYLKHQTKEDPDS